MADLISNGFVFWYPTQSLDGAQAGVVNDPDRIWFRDLAIPPASNSEYFWHISASMPGGTDITASYVHDLGLTYFSGSINAFPVDGYSQHQTQALIAYEDAGGQTLQSALFSQQLWGEDLAEGPVIQPSFIGPSTLDPAWSYDFSVGGGIFIVTSSNVTNKGVRFPTWYWTAEDNPGTSGFQQIVYNDPQEQAQFIADKFVFNPTDKAALLTAQPEKQLAKVLAYVGAIFLTASEYPGGSGNYVLDIPAYMKEDGGAGLDIYKLGI
jgi:hypothetical protein